MGKLIVTFHHDDLDEVRKTFRNHQILADNGRFWEMDAGETYGSGEKELNRLYAHGVNFIVYGAGLECGNRATISMNERMVSTPLDDYGRLVVVVDGFTEHGLIYDSEDEGSALEFLRLRQELIEEWDAADVLMDQMDQRGRGEEEPESFIEAVEEAERAKLP